MDGWLESITKWLVELIKSIFGVLFDIVYDILVMIVDAFLSVLVWIVNSLPVPDFFTSHSLSSLFSAIDPSIIFFVSALGIPEGLGIIAGGVSIRLVRKFVTLFQW